MIIALLRGYGIRADEAYPGGRIPVLTGPVAAIRLGKVDRSVRSTAVQITIMSPADQGGTVCETTALQTIQVMEDLRATCQKEVCQFDHAADVFFIEITAVFSGVALADTWSPGPGFSVYIGLQPIEWVTGFSARRQSEDGAAIASAPWTFTLEELLGPDSTDLPDPTEPFAITVARTKGDEIFTGCTLTSVEREDTLRGIRQVRKGVATGRSFSGVV